MEMGGRSVAQHFNSDLCPCFLSTSFTAPPLAPKVWRVGKEAEYAEKGTQNGREGSQAGRRTRMGRVTVLASSHALPKTCTFQREMLRWWFIMNKNIHKKWLITVFLQPKDIQQENLLINLSFTKCDISTNQSDLDIKCCCQHRLAWSVDFASWALLASSFKRMHKIHVFLKWNMTEWSIMNIQKYNIFDICNNSVNTSDRHFLILIPSIMKSVEARNEIQSKFNCRY